MRRRGSVTAACAALTVLLLVGCSGEDQADPAADDQPATTDPSAPAEPSPPGPPASAPPADHEADVAALEGVTLTGNPGTMPFFNVEPPLALTGEVARVADVGTGPAVEAGDAVAVHVASFNPQTETIEASSYEQGPELLVAEPGGLPEELLGAMVGAPVGSRVLFGAPVDGLTTIYSFEILGTGPVFEQAEGTAVTPQSGLPVLTFAADGTPAMAPAEGDPPGELVVQPLITGTGDPVTADSWLVVNYSTWLWDGTEVVSTWKDGQTTVMRLSDAIVGWQEGLAGQPIGSRVQLVVPPGKAFGAEATDRVPANSTVVVVVDILAGM
ncbi:FKBP-type peptidyl-prolyl cis-trans isomerase [Jiangella mangrovi]|uniref:peptidylprolyl isomerase n=1 Tax=Jiangella mangrovi TaxID=1524084 RepID=A0A7W9GQJ6_9ACTN|nr:FKBP-type peptidyl-prolyl cis-trans isomerase [Jiangella mangrovi]MBB5787881.1 peptidylprolyl isomerase [Jiangella mangrovi]